jgi:hypothetical protein
LSADQTRHSQAGEAELVTDPDELAQLEGLNGIRQFDAVVGMVESFLSPDRPFKFRPSHLLHLHREAFAALLDMRVHGDQPTSKSEVASIGLSERTKCRK